MFDWRRSSGLIPSKQVEKQTKFRIQVNENRFFKVSIEIPINSHYAHTNVFFRDSTCKTEPHVYVFIKLIIQIAQKYSAFIVTGAKKGAVPTSLVSHSIAKHWLYKMWIYNYKIILHSQISFTEPQA